MRIVLSVDLRKPEVIGKRTDPEANMWLNPQSWAVISAFVKPFLRFPPLPSRGQLIYITTPDPICQHLFSTFFVFFFFGETEPPLYVKEREPKAPARRVHRGCPSQPPFLISSLHRIWIRILQLRLVKTLGRQIGPVFHVPAVVRILHANDHLLVKQKLAH